MHTSRDGQLIGIETDFQFGIFRPIAALAYGLESGSIRYRAGLTLATGFKIPVVDLRLEDFSGALVDWPQTPILGREGQTGIELGLSLGPARYRAFFGELWPLDEEAPQVAYLSMEVTRSWQLPFELLLSSSSQAVMGMLLEGGGPFHSMTNTLSLRLGGLTLSGRWGSLQNQARLEAFEFTTSVRGIAQLIKGRQFWNVTLERKFTMHETSIELPIPPELVEVIPLPKTLPIMLQGALFLQAGGATREEPIDQGDGAAGQQSNGEGVELELKTEMLFSWGISATLFVHDFPIRAELIITQEGETKFSVNF
jgi:hypothetical protein